MKIRNLIVLILLTFCLTSGYTFGQATNLSQSGIESIRPSVAVNSDGVVLVVWDEAQPESRDDPAEAGVIWYNLFINGAWQGPRNAGFTRVKAWSPQLSADSRGIFHLAYADGASRYSREIFHVEFEAGVGWKNHKMIWDSPDNSAWQKIDVKDDRVYIAWFHKNVDPYAGADIIMMSKSITETEWPTMYERISWNAQHLSIHPAFKVLNGRIYICWMQGSPLESPWRLYYKSGMEGTNWQAIPDQELFNSAYYPDLEVDDEGNAYIAFWNRSGNFFVQQAGHGAQVISTRLAPFQMGDIRYKNRTYVICWTQQDSSDNYSIHYTNREKGEAWGRPELLEAGHEANHSRVWIDDNFYAHFVWEDWKDGTGWREIYYKKVLLPPSLPLMNVDTRSMDFNFQEGLSASSQGFNVSNAGGASLNYTITSNRNWINISPANGSLTFQNSAAHTVSLVNTQNLFEGTYDGTITIASNNALNGPLEIDVNLTVTAPPIYAPLNFAGTMLENKALFYVESIHHLTWVANPDNRNIEKYRLYESDGVSRFLLQEFDASTFEYTRRNIDANKTYTYEIIAVDSRGRTGPKATLII